MMQTRGQDSIRPKCCVCIDPYSLCPTAPVCPESVLLLHTPMTFHEAFLSVHTSARPDWNEVHVSRSSLQQMIGRGGG